MNNKQYKTSVQTSLNDVNFLVWKRFFENVSYVHGNFNQLCKVHKNIPYICVLNPFLNSTVFSAFLYRSPNNPIEPSKKGQWFNDQKQEKT